MFQFLAEIFEKIIFFTSAICRKGSFLRPLAKDEERALLLRAAKGDGEAKELLVKHNMRLVAHVSKKYDGVADSDDLMAVGTLGLLKAIESYDAERGSNFATFCARCIENEMLMLIRAGKKHRGNVQLSDPIGSDKDGNEITVGDLLESGDDVERFVEEKMLREELMRVLKRELSEREYSILCMRYGLEGYDPMPQREVAVRLNISRSYISRLEKRAIATLRGKLRREDYGDS